MRRIQRDCVAVDENYRWMLCLFSKKSFSRWADSAPHNLRVTLTGNADLDAHVARVTCDVQQNIACILKPINNL